MASTDHPMSDGPDPVVHTTNAVFTSSQLASTTTLNPSDVTKDTSSPENVQPEPTVTDVPNMGVESGDSAAPAPAQEGNADGIPRFTVPPGESEEQTGAPALSYKNSDASLKEPEDSGPSLTIILLLITGSRHPFKIDGAYLRNRGVNVENNDPFSISVYTLKELIWRAWQDDWESRPTSPSSIRLISFGKLLEDKAPLSDSRFSADAPNVVHMTVKPQELIDEEDAKGAKTQYPRDREASERSPRCRCVIQ
ncbi:hypothetical protein P175DRAFT_075308 [Aspergillus ochraceoroseus IBT 24754]|uniref:UBL3-like ubiquitin domain-containing protein n=3 Tax=Aspergillus subgen. Nidulantes TaxID=2720870 RepID=A0A0F8XUD0_9EURO|nr:uncharacterized protein P175DRAFT_075308 [Aspergillus ochraceoroseus IBT 24754]KKK20180.1 hypothetical protein AOCH_004055 [Aspergillus ochraceoroseus]KKK27122.1 hypothetical protein ARAM_001292 [Aspergillus rambellii]PTU25316.1 hypothetical protein P175DRAFT_075308 [Aspergillus ochraceoroseus IBT 24754]